MRLNEELGNEDISLQHYTLQIKNNRLLLLNNCCRFFKKLFTLLRNFFFYKSGNRNYLIREIWSGKKLFQMINEFEILKKPFEFLPVFIRIVSTVTNKESFTHSV